MLSSVDAEIEQVDAKIERAERMKKGLMAKLLHEGLHHKEFKDSPLGKIPAEWQVVKLGDVARSISYGITAKAVDKKTNLKMLRTTDIYDYKVNYEALPYCEVTETFSPDKLTQYQLKKDDILISRSGTTGVAVLIEEDRPRIIFGSYLIKINFEKSKVLPKYLHFYFQSSQYWQYINSSKGTGTMSNINTQILKALKIPLPPLDEQKHIAEILSAVDKYIEMLKEKREHLQRMKKGLMADLLTGKWRVMG